MQEGNLPHIWWIDLKNDGVYVECAVMKKDHFGNVSYFALNTIDDIDKRRLKKIVTNRNANHFELWDLMSNITLNNGVNALEYFHQLVTVLTPSGRKMKPQKGAVGIGEGGFVDTTSAQSKKTMEDNIQAASSAAASAAASAAVQAIYALQNPPAAKPAQAELTPAQKGAATKAAKAAAAESE